MSARTVNQIYNEILAEKAKYTSLNDLNSVSTVAIWRTIFYVMAVIIAATEQLQDVFAANLLAQAEKLPVGTTSWYAQQLLLFQQGYSLIYNKDTSKLEYPVIDTNAQILKVATCENEGSVIVLKTAKDNGSGGLMALTGDELVSVKEYVTDFKFAGSNITVISSPPDVIRLAMNVKVNKIVINGLGQSVNDNTIYPVEDAINNFLNSFQNDLYNSELKLINLIDAIQNVNGVLNVKVTLATAHPDSSVIVSDILANDLQTYKSNAGWFVVDPAYTLVDHITYL